MPCKTSQDVGTCKVECNDAFKECKKGGSGNKPCTKKKKKCKKTCNLCKPEEDFCGVDRAKNCKEKKCKGYKKKKLNTCKKTCCDLS